MKRSLNVVKYTALACIFFNILFIYGNPGQQSSQDPYCQAGSGPDGGLDESGMSV